MIKRLASLVIFSLGYSDHAGVQAVSSADVNIVSVQAEAVKGGRKRPLRLYCGDQ